MGEERATLRERIDVRRVDLGITVGAQMVGAQGINGYQDDRGGHRRVLCGARGQRAIQHQCEEAQREREQWDAMRPAKGNAAI